MNAYKWNLIDMLIKDCLIFSRRGVKIKVMKILIQIEI